MDEGISAGDARFAERATERMKEFISRSRIMVLASHSNALLQSVCNKAALLRSGRVVRVGAVDDVLEEYARSIHPGSSQAADGADHEKSSPVSVRGLSAQSGR
jgi:ABC-type polysaccharide/polyol phosphate transport system ATPase subunit